jgi:hypothetical protein
MNAPRPRPRHRSKRRLLLCLAALPALWALILLLIPTEWARSRLEDRLRATLGQPVRIGALRLGFCGGLRLHDLQVGDPVEESAPWLHVSDLRLNLSLLQVLAGQGDPNRVVADGLSLRLHRRLDGTFEFGRLLPTQGDNRGPKPGASDASTASNCTPGLMEFKFRSGRVTLIDEPSDTHLEFTAIEGLVTWDGPKVAIQDFRGKLNGGRLELAAQLDRGAKVPAFEGQMRAKGVALKDGMSSLRYLVPILAGTDVAPDGTLDMNLYLRGQGTTREEIRRSLVGQGNLTVDPIQLDGSTAVAELAAMLSLNPKDLVGSVHSQFAIGRGRVATDHLTLTLGQVPVVLAGSTDFDGRLDYRVQQDGLKARLPQEARDLLDELPIDVDELMAFRVRGTLDKLVVTAEGRSANGRDGDGTRHADERLRFRELGRRLRARIRQ